MNLLKSVFISNYMMFVMFLAGYAGWMLYQGANALAWTGVLLTSAPITLLISRLMMFKNVARTSARFPLLNLLAIVGVVMAAWAWLKYGAPIQAPVAAAASWICFIIYAYWFSGFSHRGSDRIRVGTFLPDFSVTNAHGAQVSSGQLTSTPAILIFYRGNWCPLCMAQVKELAGRYRDIAKMGIRVALISPQPHKNTINLAKKFDVPFDFLTDVGNKAARALGIENPNGLPMGMQMMGYDSDTVLPTVIITDGNGKVIWTHETDNYRIRPEPETYLEVIRSHGLATA